MSASMNYTGAGAPFMFDYKNVFNSMFNPSTMHASDTGLSRFFQRYLLQRAVSQFKWTMPEHWERNYFLYCLYCWGFVAVINTDKFGVIPQGCSLKGYNVMYAPTNAVIANPLLHGIREPLIGRQCSLIRLQPDYGGVWDLVSTYADMMAMTMSTAGSNILSSKLAYMFVSDNKSMNESLKEMYDKVASGQPAVFIDKNMIDDATGKPRYFTFANNLKSNYIATSLLEDLKEWERRFDTELGIPHTNSDKKERLVTGEVNSNVTESFTRVEMWLEELKKGCDITNQLFGDILHVDWRVDPHEMMENQNNGISESDTQRNNTKQD